MFKKYLNIYVVMTSLLVLSGYSLVGIANQDPMRPPNWMTTTTKTNVSKKTVVLQQIIISKDRKLAVINEKLVSEGDVVLGAKVKKIEQNFVKIIRSGRAITLRLVPKIKDYIDE